MKKNFFSKIIPLFSAGALATFASLSITSCGGQANPYSEIKVYDKFRISDINDAKKLMNVAELKLPVLSGGVVLATDLANLEYKFDKEQRYWEVLLYCLSQMIDNKVTSFEIEDASDALVKLRISDAPSITIDTAGYVAKNKRVCLNVTKEGFDSPISWIYVSWTVN